MLIETTFHVHRNILEKLNNAALRSGKARTSIIKLIMQRMMQNNQRMIKGNSRIQYQKRDLKEKWNRIHIALNEYEYEYYQDIRKFFKMSISLILAYAVLQYLDEVLKEDINTDKYLFRHYALIKKVFEGTTCWQIYWGIPTNLNDSTYSPT